MAAGWLWLAGWLTVTGWLAGCGWLADWLWFWLWLAGYDWLWLAGCGRLADWLAGWLTRWLAGCGWLAGWLWLAVDGWVAGVCLLTRLRENSYRHRRELFTIDRQLIWDNSSGGSTLQWIWDHAVTFWTKVQTSRLNSRKGLATTSSECWQNAGRALLCLSQSWFMIIMNINAA